jgi:Protein of unknown function (DUF2786)
MDDIRMENDRTIDLIRKLREVRFDRGATPAEAEAAAAHVQRLLQTHNLTLVDVDAKRFDEKIQVESRDRRQRRLDEWVVRLASEIALGVDCRTFFGRIYCSGLFFGYQVAFIGHKSDAAVAGFLWDSLSNLLWELGTSSGRTRGESRAGLIQYRNTFICAAAGEIGRRLRKEKEAAMPDQKTGMALIHIKSAAIKEFIERDSELSQSTNMRPSSAEFRYAAVQEGREAGKISATVAPLSFPTLTALGLGGAALAGLRKQPSGQSPRSR